jgi:methyltransferase (TIGR00027 family)
MRDEPSRTAETVCFFRASDQRREPSERIVDDPYAKMFLGPMMRTALAALQVSGRVGQRAEEYSPGLAAYILCRHRFIDDRLRDALNDTTQPIEQVVLLGAGYDTRAYRFASALRGRPVFELDFPSTSRRKAELVAEKKAELPSTNVTVVEIDFLTERVEDRLAATGFRKGARTFFVWEGVSMYLSRKAVQSTLATLRAISGAGSQLLMDCWYLLDAPDVVSTAHRMSANLLHLLGEPVTFGIHPEDVTPFLDRLSYDLVDLADAAELERRYVRDDRKVYPALYVLRAQTR